MKDHIPKGFYDEVMKENIRDCNEDHGCMITLSKDDLNKTEEK